MKNIDKVAAFLAAALTTATALKAEDMTQVDIAETCFLAVYAGDNDKVGEVASPTIAFQDPSVPEVYGVVDLNEIDPVLDLFAGFSGDGVSVEITRLCV